MKLRRLLETAFVGAEVKLEPAGAGKVGGFLIWKDFVGQDQIDRQWRLREGVQNGLTAEERLRLSDILTVTPDEVAVMDRG
jgi:hypothetical protein